MCSRCAGIQLFVGILLGCVVNPPALGQCEGWLSASGYIGVEDQVFELAAWDPDGAGPQAECLVMAGDFRAVGAEPFAYVAALQDGHFVPLGEDFWAFPVGALLVDNGELYVGGTWQVGGIYHTGVAHWDTAEQTWQQIGDDFLDGEIATLCMFDGDIVAAGNFDQVGSTPTLSVARWNGATWEPMGTGLGFFVNRLAVYQDQLYAGGLQNLRRWSGTAWENVGGLVGNCYALAADDTGLYIGGDFTSIGGQNIANVARWNGSTYSTLGAGVNSWVYSLQALGNGDVVAGGIFTQAGGTAAVKIAKWSDASQSWSGYEPGGLEDAVLATAVVDGKLYTAGRFRASNGRPMSFIAKYEGGIWQPVIDRGVTGYGGTVVYTLSEYQGDMIAGGIFDGIDGVLANGIARKVGGTWQPIGAAFNNGNDPHPDFFGIDELNGELYVGGRFVGPPGGIWSIGAARWDGAQWHGMGVGGNHNTLAVKTYDGSIYYGGLFSSMDNLPNTAAIARWDGAAWHSVGGGMSPAGQIWAMAIFNNELVVAGRFWQAGSVPVNNIAAWDGTQWHALGAGVTGDPSMILEGLSTYQGKLYTGGEYSYGVHCWNGTTWDVAGAMPNAADSVFCLVEHGGYLFAGGNFYSTIDGVPVNNIARYDGFTWDDMRGGTNNQVFALRSVGSELWVGGTTFSRVGGEVISPSLARWDNNAGVQVASDPIDQVTAVDGSVQFRVRAEGATDGVTYVWWRDEQPLLDGPTGTGAVISGADTPTLKIMGAQCGDAGTYSCNLSSGCGSVMSAAANLTVVDPSHPGDLNSDGVVNLTDLGILLGNYGTGTQPGEGDLNGDGVVDLTDLGILLGEYGVACL